jgi:UDP-glucose 4-epimerase
MTHLVTGAAGFIGSHLANQLTADGERVVAVDDLSGGFADNLYPSIPLVEANLLTLDLDDLFSEYRVKTVWHLAAYAAEGLSHWVREHNILNNWVASTRLINTAVRYDARFFYTSSMAVYGSRHTPPFTETFRPVPEDPYGIAKYAVEQDLEAASRLFGLDYTVFRPHNVYGPNQNVGDPYRNVVGIFMRQALAGKPLSVFGDGLQTRAFSYITDITRPMIRAWETNTKGLFNIGGEQPVTVLELASEVSRLFGGVPIRHVEERFEVKHAWCDHTRARQALGFSPRVDLTDGLEVMAAWVKRKGVRWTTPPPLELTVNLPEFWRENEPDLLHASAR